MCNTTPTVVLVVIMSFILNMIAGAQTSLKPSITQGETYAVIIGISDYQDDQIKDLKFAHNDAVAFADFISSPAGGNVSNENVSFLINEKATIANIYAAQQSILDRAKSGDLVYFYFSGHGDVETGLYALGFFLAHDTPYKNYLTNAIRIEDVNMWANGMSISKDVKVVLVTDACHSGRISGQDNRGNQLIGAQLSKMEKNEIRLASCEPDQKSEEGEAWGKGRGVFSYYLLNGLMGMADIGDEDGIILLNELKMYIEEKVTADVAKIKSSDQVPVVKGKGLSKMAIVDNETKSMIIEQVNLKSSMLLASKSIYEPSDSDIYFDNLSKIDFLGSMNFTDWQKKKSTKIIKEALKTFKNCETGKISDSKWRKSLKKDKLAKKNYGLRLASAFHNAVQPLVNSLMEKKKRRYTDKGEMLTLATKLDKCVVMLNIAHKLVDEDNYLYKIIGVKKHWTKAMALKLQMPFSDDPKAYARESQEEQIKALEYEDQAGYIKFSTSYKKTTTTKRTRTITNKENK